MDVFVDFAYHNVILIEKNNLYEPIDNLESVFLKFKENFNIFIISHPGSYTGIRKALTLSIIQLYCERIRIYELNLIEYLKTFANNVGIVINKHIWFYANNIEKVTSINNMPDNIEVCNNELPYKCKIVDISVDTLWKNRYQIFKINENIIYPKYFDQFV